MGEKQQRSEEPRRKEEDRRKSNLSDEQQNYSGPKRRGKLKRRVKEDPRMGK
jgi:hypothetical protein